MTRYGNKAIVLCTVALAMALASGCEKSGTDNTQAAGEAPESVDQALAEDNGKDHGKESASPTANPVKPEANCSKEEK